MQLATQGHYLLTVSEKGMGKRTSISEFSVQGRGGKGVKCYKITEKTGNVVGAKAVNDENEILMITTEGIVIRISCADISILGRITSGVKLMNLSEGVKVASFTKVREKDPANSQETADAENRPDEETLTGADASEDADTAEEVLREEAETAEEKPELTNEETDLSE